MLLQEIIASLHLFEEAALVVFLDSSSARDLGLHQVRQTESHRHHPAGRLPLVIARGIRGDAYIFARDGG